MRDRFSSALLLLLPFAASCGFFGLSGDDSVVRIECVGGAPVLESLFVGVTISGYLSAEDPDTLASTCGGAGNGDRSYQLVAPQSGAYELRLYSDFDAVLYGVTSPCDAPRIADCVDDNGTFTSEVLAVDLEAGVPYVVVVDGFTAESYGSYTLEAVLTAGGGESESDGDTDPGTGCADVDQPLETTWTGDRWTGNVGGSTFDRPDQFVSACGGSGSSDDAWRFTPPEPGVYRVSLPSSEFQGIVSVRDASCSEISCDDGAASTSSPHPPTLEVLLSSDAYDIVVDGAGTYQLTVEQVLDAEVSPTCQLACATVEDCSGGELCLSTTEGQVCLASLCESCFAQGLTCWSYPYSCGGISCS